MDNILNLVQEYLLLDDGVLISHHEELMEIVKISDLNESHPHKSKVAYVTRRALKHIVESRRRDLCKRHNPEEVLAIITFAVQSITNVIPHFDHYELEPDNKHFYTKDFSASGMPKIRVLLNVVEGNLHIKSVHFVKRTKKHHE